MHCHLPVVSFVNTYYNFYKCIDTCIANAWFSNIISTSAMTQVLPTVSFFIVIIISTSAMKHCQHLLFPILTLFLSVHGSSHIQRFLFQFLLLFLPVHGSKASNCSFLQYQYYFYQCNEALPTVSLFLFLPVAWKPAAGDMENPWYFNIIQLGLDIVIYGNIVRENNQSIRATFYPDCGKNMFLYQILIPFYSWYEKCLLLLTH